MSTLPGMISLSCIPITLLIVFCGTLISTYLIYRYTAPSHAARIPLVCNMGSRGPAAVIFSSGCAISSFLMLICTLIQIWRYDQIIDIHDNFTTYHSFNYVTGVLGTAASLLFCLFTSISVSTYETYHNRCARLFAIIGILYQLAMAILTVVLEQDASLIIVRFLCVGISLISSLLSIPLIMSDALHHQMARAGVMTTPPHTRTASIEMTIIDVLPTRMSTLEGQTTTTAISKTDPTRGTTSYRDSTDPGFMDFEIEMIEPSKHQHHLQTHQHKQDRKEGERKGCPAHPTHPHPITTTSSSSSSSRPWYIIPCWALLQYLSLLSCALFYGTFIPDFSSIHIIHI